MPHADKSPEEVLRILEGIDALQELRRQQSILMDRLRSAILREYVKVESGPSAYGVRKAGSFDQWLYNRLREQAAQGGEA